jgi:hypothetical protein
MNKKIIVFFIVGMFMLMSCISFSTIGMKTSVSEQSSKINLVKRSSEDLPDLTIEVIITPGPLYYYVNAIIRNVGTAPVPSTYIVWEIKVSGEEDQLIGNTQPLPLAPGESIYGLPQGVRGVPYLKLKHSGFEVTVIVDPILGDKDGEIKESNENNNFDIGTFPYVKSYDPFSPLFYFLSRISIIQRILEK